MASDLLHARASGETAFKASPLADLLIDWLGDKYAPPEVQTKRKRRLLKGRRNARRSAKAEAGELNLVAKDDDQSQRTVACKNCGKAIVIAALTKQVTEFSVKCDHCGKTIVLPSRRDSRFWAQVEKRYGELVSV